MELTMNEGGKKRPFPPAQEMSVEKKMKTSSAAREGPFAVKRYVIDLTSSNGKKSEAIKSEPMMSAMPKMASTITDRIAQHRGSVMSQVSNFISRRALGAKCGSPLERLATMKNDKVDFIAKVAPRPIPFAAEIGSPTEKEEIACVGICEKSTKPVSGEAVFVRF
ncbi:hypothetical protein ACFX13_019413 [Malus domestica]